MWERFSYYGMRALLVLFMVDMIQRGGLGLDDRTATAIYGLYTAAVYLAGLPGGWIADRLLGAHRSVWYGGLIIMAGHFTLAIPSPASFFPGLLLVAVGTGLLKPNISTMVGRLYPQQERTRRDSGFVLFYMGINLGALLGPLVCGWLGEHPELGWHYGFAAAGVGMALGLAQYRANYRFLSAHPDNLRPLHPDTAATPKLLIGGGLIAVLLALGISGLWRPDLVLLAQLGTLLILALFVGYFVKLFFFSGFDDGERNKLIVLAVLCLASAIFWSGFEQAGSSLNLFAKRYTLREFGDFTIPAGWFQSVNPLFVIMLAPLSSTLWLSLAKRGVEPSEPVKFGLALIMLGLGFGIMSVAATQVSGGQQVLPVWLLSTYLVHTMAELCLSPIGLSAVSRLAPRAFTGQLMGLWFLTGALGNLLAGLLAGRFDAEAVGQMPSLYAQIVLLGLVSGLVLLLLARRLGRLSAEPSEL